MEKEIYSLCFMCSVRCPIKVYVKDGQVNFIEGNPHVAGMEGSLCPRGSAGISLLYDDERVKDPMIRVGERGEGHFRKVSWDEALDYVADKLKPIIEEHGGHSLVIGERTQLATHATKTFLKAIKSPNQFTHDALCKGSVNTACRSLFGYTDGQMGMDVGNTKHLVLYGRNIFESVQVKEVNNLMKALGNGAELTYIDPRVTITATKARRYWMIRPGTDLALNYALIHVILKERLYDAEFVNRWVTGLSELQDFVNPYTPEWAEKETGIAAGAMIDLARRISKVKPNVIFSFGYRGANHPDEIYFRRSIMILNSLMGSVESKGGFFFKKGPGEEGGKPARKLTEQKFSKIGVPRFDKVGTPDFPLPDPNHGVGQMLPNAILNEDPYPIKAFIAFRFDPLMSIPDTNLTKKAFKKLDLIVSIDINYSDIAWYSDVILPESSFLERTDSLNSFIDRFVSMLPSDFMSWHPLSRAQFTEIKFFLSNYLLSSQGDRMAMANSVEGRYPFLDHRVVEFATRVPLFYRMNGLKEKFILKQAARGLIPTELIDRPKQPYRAPISKCFFQDQPLDYVEDLLCESAIKQNDYFDTKKVSRLTAKCRNKEGRILSERENMALVGILSTQLLDHQFIRNFQAFPVQDLEDVKIFNQLDECC